MAYINLKAEMIRRNVSVSDIARAAGKSVSATSKNINGKGDLTVEEGLEIRDKFFADLSMDYLFAKA